MYHTIFFPSLLFSKKKKKKKREKKMKKKKKKKRKDEKWRLKADITYEISSFAGFYCPMDARVRIELSSVGVPNTGFVLVQR